MPTGTPFQPGQSGNPRGRPKEVDGLRAMIRAEGMPLVRRLFDIALAGPEYSGPELPSAAESIRAAEVLLSYGFGKPAQQVELTVERRDPLGVEAARDAAREVLTDPEAREALRAALREGAGIDTGSTTSTADYVAPKLESVHPLPANTADDAFHGLFHAFLAAHPRVAIAGGPRTGKTTLAAAAQSARKCLDDRVFHGDDLIRLGWSAASETLAYDVNQLDGPLIVEGVQVPRALRKGMSIDGVIWMRTPWGEQTREQAAMAKGCETVFNEWRQANPDVPVLVGP